MNKEISLKTFLIILGSLVLLELIIMCLIIPYFNYQELKEHCGKKDAVCNPENTICFNYGLEDGKTVVTWRGSCKKYFK